MTDITENDVSDEKGSNPVREVILTLVNERGVGTTIDPSEAARMVSETNWRKVMNDVRAEAVRLAKTGEISIYRKGVPVADLDKFKGVWRIGLPGYVKKPKEEK